MIYECRVRYSDISHRIAAASLKRPHARKKASDLRININRIFSRNQRVFFNFKNLEIGGKVDLKNPWKNIGFFSSGNLGDFIFNFFPTGSKSNLELFWIRGTQLPDEIVYQNVSKLRNFSNVCWILRGRGK